MDEIKKVLKTLVNVQKTILERVGKSESMIRAVINGQSSMKSELLGKIGKVDNKVVDLQEEMKKGFREVNCRLDKQGNSLAYLEDDAPTIEEFDKLEKRVTKLEVQVVKN